MRNPTLLAGLSSALLALLVAGPAIHAQDSDGDGINDPGDNCVNVPNPAQLNTDGDALGNVCDCAPSVNNAVETALGPPTDLVFTSKSDLEWTAPLDLGGPGVSYDVLRSGLPSDFTSAFCVESDENDTVASDATPPITLSSYLVRAEGSCGGNQGSGSAEARRTATPCPSGVPLPQCSIDFEGPCPTSALPVCMAGFTGSGCVFAGLPFCYSSGLFSYEVNVATPLTIDFADDVNQLSVFFSEQGAAVGTMRFFDTDNLEVGSPISTNGDCLVLMPPMQNVGPFSRPVRRIRVTSVGGTVWVDDLSVN